MGYDMYIENQEGLDKDKEEEYFRLNIWGMQSHRQAIQAHNAGYWADHPTWPKYEDFGLTEEEYEDAHDDNDNLNDKQKAYLAAQEAIKAWKHPDGKGVALHKFCSNDGWLVTEEECKEALAIEKEWTVSQGRTDDAPNAPGDVPDWWDEWVAYLERASTRGGFRVW